MNKYYKSTIQYKDFKNVPHENWLKFGLAFKIYGPVMGYE